MIRLYCCFTKLLITCLTLAVFEAFNHSSILDKTVFCLGEEQSMFIYDGCMSWYNGVGDFVNVSLG